MGDAEISNFLRLAAIEEKALLTEHRAVLLAQHSDSFKWLNASLLAINGGGAVAVLNSDSIEIQNRLVAGGFFCFGLLITLLIGVFTQSICNRNLPVVQRQIGYWLSVAEDGERDDDLEENLRAEGQRVNRWAWLTAAIGWVSGLAFVVGAIFLGYGLYQNVVIGNV